MELFLNGILLRSTWRTLSVLFFFSSLAFADQPLKIGLASHSKVKRTAVENAFKALYPTRNILIQEFDAPSEIAEQPVSEAAGRRGAENRLKSARSKTSERFDYWVSIENFILLKNGDFTLTSAYKWEDLALVFVLNTETGAEEVELSKAVPVSGYYAEKAKRAGEVIWSGFSTTVGKIIQQEYSKKGMTIPSDDWHAHPDFGGVSRVDLIKDGIIQAVLKSKTLTVPNFPKPGILFRSMIPILADGDLFDSTIKLIAEKYQNQKIDYVLGLDSRGYILGASLASKLNAGFVQIAKKGKLPPPVLKSVSYEKEYGRDAFEISKFIDLKDKRVILVDDLIATGGSLVAAEQLIKESGANLIGTFCLYELKSLDGRKHLSSPFTSLIQYQ